MFSIEGAHFKSSKQKKLLTDRDRTRTCNPQIRSLMPYPLGHTATVTFLPKKFTCPNRAEALTEVNVERILWLEMIEVYIKPTFSKSSENVKKD